MRRMKLRNPGGGKPFWKCDKTHGKVVRDGKGGVDWYRYQKLVLIPKLLPFAKKCMIDRPNTIVQEEKAPSAWTKCWTEELTQKRIQSWIERIKRHVDEVILLDGGKEYREGREIGVVRPYNKYLSMQIYPCKVAFLAAYLALARTFGVILRSMTRDIETTSIFAFPFSMDSRQSTALDLIDRKNFDAKATTSTRTC